jgi:hypothetical protein
MASVQDSSEAAAELGWTFSPNITGWQVAAEVADLHHLSLGTGN